MIRVTVDLLSSQPGPSRSLARIDVFNTGEGSETHGHYACEAAENTRFTRRVAIGLVKRNATGPIALVARALHALGYVVPEAPRDTDVGRCEARFRDYVARELSLGDADIEAACTEVFGKQGKSKESGT